MNMAVLDARLGVQVSPCSSPLEIQLRHAAKALALCPSKLSRLCPVYLLLLLLGSSTACCFSAGSHPAPLPTAFMMPVPLMQCEEAMQLACD